jgi:hypothetical protein
MFKSIHTDFSPGFKISNPSETERDVCCLVLVSFENEVDLEGPGLYYLIKRQEPYLFFVAVESAYYQSLD